MSRRDYCLLARSGLPARQYPHTIYSAISVQMAGTGPCFRRRICPSTIVLLSLLMSAHASPWSLALGGAVVAAAGELPVSTLTPGALNPAVTQETISLLRLTRDQVPLSSFRRYRPHPD